MRPKLILLLTLCFVPALCRAEESCSWLNAATAGGVLEGAVTVAVTPPRGNRPDAVTANAKSSAGPMNANPTGASYSKSGLDDSDCVFIRRADATRSEMRIEVRTVNESRREFTSRLARCRSNPLPLKAIGNEAQACDLDSKGGQLAEQVVGRVRDRIFLVRINTNDSSMMPSLREKVRQTSELVAGNLF
jgi:hypothetical protein